jgi:hypothetical protein
MPAWMAGIQAPQDASGDIHVGLDSSTPCWNDGIEGFYWNSPSPLLPYFQRRTWRGRATTETRNISRKGAKHVLSDVEGAAKVGV